MHQTRAHISQSLMQSLLRNNSLSPSRCPTSCRAVLFLVCARATDDIKIYEKLGMEHGYAAVTIRSVAKACGVGVGTVYNYFPSKDALVASYLLGDWKHCVADIQAASEVSDSPEPVVRCIFDQLIGYAKKQLERMLEC